MSQSQSQALSVRESNSLSLPEQSRSRSLITSLQDAVNLARVLAASGYFRDVKKVSQAVVKIMAGYELGIGAIAAMRNIIISDKGEIALSSNLCAALIQASKQYSYVVKRWDHEGCILHFFRDAQFLGESSFTRDDAIKADLAKKATYKLYPRNLYFARAMTNGIKVFCPEVGNGLAVYSPEELDLEQLETALATASVNTPIVDDLQQTTQTSSAKESEQTGAVADKINPEHSAIDGLVVENDEVALNTGDPDGDRINQVLLNDAIKTKGEKNGRAFFEQFLMKQTLDDRRKLARKLDPSIPEKSQEDNQFEPVSQDPRAQLATVKTELLRRGGSEQWLNEELEKLFDQVVTVETLDDEQVAIALDELTALLDQTEPAE
jgi:hypothetical protein